MSKKIIALISDDFEDLELWYPVHRLREEDGVTVDVVGEEKGKTYIGKYGVPACRTTALTKSILTNTTGFWCLAAGRRISCADSRSFWTWYGPWIKPVSPSGKSATRAGCSSPLVS